MFFPRDCREGKKLERKEIGNKGGPESLAVHHPKFNKGRAPQAKKARR